MSVTQRPSGKPRNASMINIKVNEYCGSAGKESTCNVGDLGSIPGLGRSPGRGHGNPFVFLPGESPWTEEPGGLQYIVSQRVGHD